MKPVDPYTPPEARFDSASLPSSEVADELHFKKTRIMNMVGAIGLTLYVIRLFFQLTAQHSKLTFVLAWAVAIAIPIISAKALSSTTSRGWIMTARVANWICIIYACWSMGTKLYFTVPTLHYSSDHPEAAVILITRLISAALIFVLPQCVNFRAFSAILKSRKSKKS